MYTNQRIGNFDISYDPWNSEQILAGQLTARESRTFFDVWTSFPARSSRQHPTPHKDEILLRDCRIDATVNPDLTLSAVTRIKVTPTTTDMRVATFDIASEMQVSEVTVDGQPAEALQRDSLRLNVIRGGNSLFLVVPPEPLKVGREYEFEFHHTGKVIHDAGDRVFYVSARGVWYPIHGSQYIAYDLRFRYPRDLELVAAGDVVEERTEGDWKITRRRTAVPIRLAAFNLGNYAHTRLERGGYVVDVYANRSLERALDPRMQAPLPPPASAGTRPRRPDLLPDRPLPAPEPNPLERMHTLADEVASALEFMAARFGPPALPHLAVTPLPGTFGQGFPGLIYLSTLSYLKNLPDPRSKVSEVQHIFYEDALQVHETAHQWWGNRISAATYRDYWLMEALANYSAMLYLDKSKGSHAMDTLLESYRMELLAKSESGLTVDSAGPIVLGWRLSSSQEPRGWRTITYGKGSWLMHMLRERMGTERFMSMLTALIQRYDGQEITTEQFREMAAQFLPAKSDDPKLESFFEQWVYGTGIPNLKLTYSVKGKAPALRVVGTITQSEVDEDFSTLVPVEIQVARGKAITQWVRTGATPTIFTVALKQAPTKVALDPRRAVLRR
jgi:aminopeptidase N